MLLSQRACALLGLAALLAVSSALPEADIAARIAEPAKPAPTNPCRSCFTYTTYTTKPSCPKPTCIPTGCEPFNPSTKTITLPPNRSACPTTRTVTSYTACSTYYDGYCGQCPEQTKTQRKCYTETETVGPTTKCSFNTRTCAVPQCILLSTTTVPPTVCGCKTTPTATVTSKCPTKCPGCGTATTTVTGYPH